MSFWLELIISFLLLSGGTFILIGSIGLVRLRDFYMRLHAPTKATTLGIGTLLLALAIVVSVEESALSVHTLVISLFLSITAPISAHMLAKAALHHKIAMDKSTKNPHLADKAYHHQPPTSPDSPAE